MTTLTRAVTPRSHDEIWNNFHQERLVAFSHTRPTGPYMLGVTPQTWNASHIITAIDCGCTDSLLLRAPRRIRQVLPVTVTTASSLRDHHVVWRVWGQLQSCWHCQETMWHTRTQCRLWPFPDVTPFSRSDVILWRGRRLSQNGRCYYSALMILSSVTSHVLVTWLGHNWAKVNG